MTTSRQRAAAAKVAKKVGAMASVVTAATDAEEDSDDEERAFLPGREAREKRAAMLAKREEQDRRRKEDPTLRAQVLSLCHSIACHGYQVCQQGPCTGWGSNVISRNLQRCSFEMWLCIRAWLARAQMAASRQCRWSKWRAR